MVRIYAPPSAYGAASGHERLARGSFDRTSRPSVCVCVCVCVTHLLIRGERLVARERIHHRRVNLRLPPAQEGGSAGERARVVERGFTSVCVGCILFFSDTTYSEPSNKMRSLVSAESTKVECLSSCLQTHHTPTGAAGRGTLRLFPGSKASRGSSDCTLCSVHATPNPTAP